MFVYEEDSPKYSAFVIDIHFRRRFLMSTLKESGVDVKGNNLPFLYIYFHRLAVCINALLSVHRWYSLMRKVRKINFKEELRSRWPLNMLPFLDLESHRLETWHAFFCTINQTDLKFGLIFFTIKIEWIKVDAGQVNKWASSNL